MDLTVDSYKNKLMEHKLELEALTFVKKYLEEGLTSDHTYHNFAHTISVLKAASLLAGFENVSERDKDVLALAAIFHDTGIVDGFDDHEARSAEIARTFLENRIAKDVLEDVERCIRATQYGKQPQDLLEKIIRDADVNNLGNDSYLPSTNALLHEINVFSDKDYTKEKWYEIALSFARQHQYFTESALLVFGEKKKENIALLEEKLEKAQRKISSKRKRPIEGKLPIMIFKTALRNHIDLSALADGKANTMLSANALIITITLPLMLNTLKEDIVLGIPASILLITCILSMIYATSATRPIKTLGITTEEQIRNGTADLFFFGNFYNMTFDKYREGMDYILAQEDYLDETTYRNLFYSGKALGGKFNKLRICYSIFIVGIILTVIGYAIAYTFSFSY